MAGSEKRIGPARDALEISTQYVEGQSLERPRKTPLSAYDVWNLRTEGDWLRFEGRLPGADGPRGYRLKDPGPIIADSHPTLVGIFELGGQPVAQATPGGSAFPYHVFCADDDIGPVGMAGLEDAPKSAGLAPMRERTIAALVAETLLAWQYQDSAVLPLFYVRSESESIAKAADLSTGKALANLGRAVENWLAAARANECAAELSAIIVDFAGDDLSSSADEYANASRAVFDALQRQALGDRLARAPRLLTIFESGAHYPVREVIIEGQTELALFPGAHDLIFAAPGYMFALDVEGEGWLSEKGRLHKAEMLAAALTYAPRAANHAAAQPPSETWHCPMPVLADWKNGAIEVTCRAIGELVLDRSDPFAAGEGLGFKILTDDGALPVADVEISSRDKRALR
ncbi:MAG: hypothetical protein AAF841_09640, partial [Pseudomonadota bacterium]